MKFQYIQQGCRKFLVYKSSMIDFTFAGLFKTTLKGIPDIKSLPSTINMPRSYFIYSAVLQSVLLLIFILYFALSVFRVAKRIKNGKFRDVPDPFQVEKQRERDAQRKREEGGNNEQTGLVYQFDEVDEVEQMRDNKVMDQNGQTRSKQYQFEKYHDQNQYPFIKLDAKLLSFMPFLMSFIIGNNLFTTNIVTICLLAFTITSYFIFNIKRKFLHIKALQYIHIVLSIVGNFSFFYADHHLSS